MKIPGFKKIIFICLVAAVIVLFFGLDLQQYMTLAYIKASRDNFQALLAGHPVAVTAGFVLLYIAVISLSIPAAAVMTLAAGALFGLWGGIVIASFASSIGATIACAIARYLFRDWAKARLGTWYDKINAGIQQEGGFYLFALRLIPVIPFFAINLGMAFTEIRLWTFYWVTQAGMLIWTFVYANAGNQLGRISTMGDILSPGLIISLLILGFFPLAAKKIINFITAKTGREAIVPDTKKPGRKA